MLRVLTLSTLFPTADRPTLGVFVERQTLALAAREGVEVQVVSPVGLPFWPLSLHPHFRAGRTYPAMEAWKALRIHRPPFRVRPWAGPARKAGDLAAALLPHLRRIRADFPFDVIDAEFFWPDGPAALRLSQALGVPFSIKARGSDILFWGRQAETRRLIVEAGNAAGGLLAVSEALARDMAALGIERPVAVHRTGIDLDRFAPADRAVAKARLGLSGPLIITAGALIPRKGQELAIRALQRLPGAGLVLIGDGPDRARLERLTRSCGVSDRARFIGVRPHEELPAWFAAADVALQPSEAEGLANVWVEALACGTPVVTCDAGGAREVITGPEAGRIVAREPEALARAVRDLLSHAPSPQSVRRFAEPFSWDRNGRELEAHLRATVSSGAEAA